MGLQPIGSVAGPVALLMVLTSCGGSSPPDRPALDPPSAVPGATIVYGTERLSWLQPGDSPGLLFRAYVNGNPVALDDAKCNWPAPEAECSSPLPPLSDGVHTITVAALSGDSSLESEASESITVQKVSARSVVSAASFPDARFAPDASRLDAAVTAYGGQAFAIDVIARGLNGPVQLASIPDGRVLVSEGDARVRVVRPGGLDSRDDALDARALLQPSPLGGLGLAVHPDFARNQFVYVSFLARDGADRTVLRIVRLRAVADTLGEPLSLFEAPIVATVGRWRNADDGQGLDVPAALTRESPRLAFGPDRLLYALLPPGLEFHNEPAASSPHPSMLRIADDGRVPEVGPLTGIVAHPLGLAWHPTTAALWLIVPGTDGEALVQPSSASSVAGVDGAGRGVLRMTAGLEASSGALALQPSGLLQLAPSFQQAMTPESIGVLRLVVPILAESVLTGVSGRIADLVPAGAGTLYLTISDPGDVSNSGDVVVRLRPQAR
jgi:hypothetical protein